MEVARVSDRPEASGWGEMLPLAQPADLERAKVAGAEKVAIDLS